MIRNLFNRNTKLYKDVNTYCMFIGYPRSGHTLYGALLDAHPDCIISHELNVLHLLKQGKSKYKIFDAILNNSRDNAQSGRENEGYKYLVKDQWQGKLRLLNVIGDKQGGRSSRMLSDEPELLDQLSAKLNIPIRILHVYRNPFDNLASRSKGGKLQKKLFSNDGLKKDIERHFIQAEINHRIRKDDRFKVMDIKHEDFIDAPESGLKQICEFLGLEPHLDYLQDCASIVFKKPTKTRNDIEFTNDIINIVKKRIKDYDFLSVYTFEE